MTNHQAPNEANMMSHSIDKTSGLEPSLCFTHTLGGNLTHLTLRLEFFAFFARTDWKQVCSGFGRVVGASFAIFKTYKSVVEWRTRLKRGEHAVHAKRVWIYFV